MMTEADKRLLDQLLTTDLDLIDRTGILIDASAHGVTAKLTKWIEENRPTRGAIVAVALYKMIS